MRMGTIDCILPAGQVTDHGKLMNALLTSSACEGSIFPFHC